MSTSAKVIADSIGPDGQRVTTMEVTMHRFVLAEFNTHRVFSRNSASSRAIPVTKQLDAIDSNPAYPAVWASEKPGMQGGPPLTGEALFDAERLFAQVLDFTWDSIQRYVNDHPLVDEGDVRLHKSLLNRLLEPFMWHTVIVTSTEWDNFFALRCHELAQPEIRIAAEMMRDEYEQSTPRELKYGEWHMPFTGWTNYQPVIARMLKKSVARCAWVSTGSHDGDRTLQAVERMYDRLKDANPMHASPFEHQCTPMHPRLKQIGNLQGFRQLRHYIEGGRDLNHIVRWVALGGDSTDELVTEYLDEQLDPDGHAPTPTRKDRPGDTQPLPVPSRAPIAHRLVQDDLEERLRIGIERYGQPLQPFNGRDSLQDAYEEILDLAVYLRAKLYEEHHGDG